MFEEVGDSRTGEGAFVLGTGFDPDLGTDDRRIRDGIQDGVETVCEGFESSRGGRKFHEGTVVAGRDSGKKFASLEKVPDHREDK